MWSRQVVMAVVVAGCLWPARAFAQANPVAETLFREGKQHIKAGKIADACKAFEGSERLEHDIVTVLSLADCREREGKLATAWGLFLQAERETRNDPAKAQLNDVAKKRAVALEGKLSYLTINVSDEARIPQLVITRDEQVVDAAEWNTAIPIDRGDHVIAGKAPGHEAWSTTITIGANDRKSVEVPRFKVLENLAPERVVQAPPAEPPPEAPPGTFTTRRKLALGLGIGAVVIAGGAFALGASAQGLRDDALARCPPDDCSADDASAAQALNDRGRDRALYANIGFALAGAAAIGAGVLWFTGAPESSRVAITPLAGPVNGVALGGSF